MSLRTIVLPLVALLLLPAFANGQEDLERRIAKLREKVEAHVTESKQLADQGKEEAAAEHMAAAKNIELRILDIMKAREDRSREGMSREQVITALKQGIVALRTIDRMEEAQHLGNILEEYARGKRVNKERAEKAKTERQVAAETIEIMQLAFGWLAETGHKDAAAQMEHVIDARRLILKGNREGEAGEVIRSMPGRGQQIELLTLAAEVMSEHDRGAKKAELVRRLASQFRRPGDETGRKRETNQATERRMRRDAERRDVERRERTAHERLERERDSRTRYEERIKRLEDQIKDLREAVESMRKRVDR